MAGAKESFPLPQVVGDVCAERRCRKLMKVR